MHLGAVWRMPAVEHPDAPHQRAIVCLRDESQRRSRKNVRLDLRMERALGEHRSVEGQEREGGVRRHVRDDVDAERVIRQNILR